MRAYLLLTGTLFGPISLLHLVRLLSHSPAVVGGWTVPVWISGMGFVAAGSLCLWAFRLARR